MLKPPMRGRYKTRAEYEEAMGFYRSRVSRTLKGKRMEASEDSQEKSVNTEQATTMLPKK